MAATNDCANVFPRVTTHQMWIINARRKHIEAWFRLRGLTGVLALLVPEPEAAALREAERACDLAYEELNEALAEGMNDIIELVLLAQRLEIGH